MAFILVVDDELSMRQFLQILLKKEGYEVLTAEHGARALEILGQRKDIAVVLMDYNMPEAVDGIELLRRIRQIAPYSQVMIITAYASTEQAISAIEIGAVDYISKPFNVTEIRDLVRKAVIQYEHITGETGSRDTGTPPASGVSDGKRLIAESPAMKKLKDQADRIAATDTIVLISGESGAGKEVVARYIHDKSNRSNAQWYPINCGAIPESLQESELFGYEKGAFTGANQTKKGYFEAAEKGTLFLDEIADLSPGAQVTLFRVLQEKMFIRVGGTEPIRAMARLVAATNKDLEKEIEQGRFREELYYRLNVFELTVPPLRERKEDILPMAEVFLSQICEREKTKKKLASESEEFLLSYEFPGNVRELKNMIERGVIFSKGEIITVDDLAAFSKETKILKNTLLLQLPADLDAVLAEYEKAYIAAALAKSGGNRQKTAELLGLTDRSLRYRMDKLGLKE